MQRFFVGKSFRSAPFIGLLILTAILVGLTGWAWSSAEIEAEIELAFLLGIPATIAALGCAIWTIAILRARAWLEVGDGLFVLTRGKRSTTVQHSEISSIALRVDLHQVQGQIRSISRRVQVAAATMGAPVHLAFRHTYRLKASDDLFGAWLGQLLDDHGGQQRDLWKSGARVAGEGWSIEGNNLQLERAHQTVPLAEVTAVSEVDDHLNIWRLDEEGASIRLPIQGPNAWALKHILDQHLEENPPRSGNTPTGLGRILFERRAGARFARYSGPVALGVILLGGGIGYYLRDEPGALVAAGFVAGCGALLLVLGLLLRSTYFRCHELGVVRKTITGLRSIRYDEVLTFTHSATRQFVNGVYVGTAFAFSFDPLPESGRKKIHYAVTMQRADDEMQGLVDHISNVVADRMATFLADDKPVPWTKSLTIRPDGVEHRPKKLFNKKPVFVPWKEVHGFDIQDGHFHLWQSGAKKSVVVEPVSAPNFFPGYYLLTRIFTPSDDEAAREEG